MNEHRVDRKKPDGTVSPNWIDLYKSLCSVLETKQGFPVILQSLWKDMATGSDFAAFLVEESPHFNGGLFEDTTALRLRPDQILLIHAAKSDWAAVNRVAAPAATGRA